jgi:hypothetical protein
MFAKQKKKIKKNGGRIWRQKISTKNRKMAGKNLAPKREKWRGKNLAPKKEKNGGKKCCLPKFRITLYADNFKTNKEEKQGLYYKYYLLQLLI